MSEVAIDPRIGTAEALLPADMHAVGSVAHPRHLDANAAARRLPRGDLSAFQRSVRYLLARIIAKTLASWCRVEIVGAERLSAGPAVYCFNHLGWLDPVVILAAFPREPRLAFYGPKQPDLRKGTRNRFMWFFGICVPFSPLKDDLLTSIKWAQAVFDTGGAIAISGEGTIHVHEGDLLRFEEGAAYLALRGGVPLVPVAITGTSWVPFRGRVQIRIGEAIPTGDRPTRQALAHYTARIWHAVKAMVANDHELPRPGPISSWFSEGFNDWGPGGREAASKLRGPDPADVPIPPLHAG